MSETGRKLPPSPTNRASPLEEMPAERVPCPFAFAVLLHTVYTVQETIKLDAWASDIGAEVVDFTWLDSRALPS